MGIGIQSKLLAMLLGVSLVTALVVGFIGYRSGTDSLRVSAEKRLVQIREARHRALDKYFNTMETSLIMDTKGTTSIDAVRGFTKGFAELQDQPRDPKRTATVEEFYEESFVPDFEERTGSDVDAEGFVPRDPAAEYLQAEYTASSNDYDKKLAVDDAGDGSDWSKTHQTYHDYYRELTQRVGYEDVFLLDTKGNVVYSAFKGTDLGTNVDTGPYRGGALQKIYDEALQSNSVDWFGLSDFERYQPSLDVPTAFAASPIGIDGEIEGVLVVQLPQDRINDLMTGSQRWVKDGLGETGETYLAGPDRLMRSTSRYLIEDPAGYEKLAIDSGTPTETVQRAVAVKGTVLLQPVDTSAVDKGLRGQTGIEVSEGYLGREALHAYAPIELPGENDVQWVVVAEIQSSEAFAPVTLFARNLAISTAALILVICLAALLLAQVFTRPIKRLVSAVRKVAGGDLDTKVPVNSRDEFGDLGAAFNDMSSSLQTKSELLDEQQAENDRLLLTLMPETVAKRYREGEETIAQEHDNVSVVFADIVGMDRLTAGLSSHDSLKLTNALARSFDEAAERIGVEKVRPLRNGYLASCGLVVPRLDNARRMVEFATEMDRIVQRFNAEHDSQLSLRAGIDTGNVSSGLVGRSSVVYDMWGEAVNLAHQIRNTTNKPGIFVSSHIYDRLRNEFTFAEASPGDGANNKQPIWVLSTEDAHV